MERPPGDPPRLRDAVVYPAGDTVEVRALEAGEDAGLRLTVRGAARQALSPGSLLLSPQAELLTARRALVIGSGLEGTRTITAIPRPRQPDAPVAAVRCTLERLPGPPVSGPAALYLLRAERPLPLIPGRAYHFGAGEGTGTVVLSGPRPAGISQAGLARLAAGVDPLDSPAVESLFLRVYGIAPRLSPDGDGSRGRAAEDGGGAAKHGGPAAQRFTDWLVGAEYIDEIGELFVEVLRRETELPVAALRDLAESHRLFVPRTGFRELLAAVAERRGLDRRGGMVALGGGAKRRPAGDEPRLSPAERSVLDVISAAGRAGEHINSGGMRPARDIVERLIARGLVVKLPNGRLYERGVFCGFAEVTAEVDDRRAAERWGVSRNTARELMDRLVAEGLMRRTSPRTAVKAGGAGASASERRR